MTTSCLPFGEANISRVDAQTQRGWCLSVCRVIRLEPRSLRVSASPRAHNPVRARAIAFGSSPLLPNHA